MAKATAHNVMDCVSSFFVRLGINETIITHNYSSSNHCFLTICERAFKMLDIDTEVGDMNVDELDYILTTQCHVRGFKLSITHNNTLVINY
jgi:hypothetical protein